MAEQHRSRFRRLLDWLGVPPPLSPPDSSPEPYRGPSKEFYKDWKDWELFEDNYARCLRTQLPDGRVVIVKVLQAETCQPPSPFDKTVILDATNNKQLFCVTSTLQYDLQFCKKEALEAEWNRVLSQYRAYLKSWEGG